MIIFGYALCVATTIIAVPFPESPRLLLAHGKIDKLRKAIDILAWTNKVTIDWSRDVADFEARAARFANNKSTSKILPMSQAIAMAGGLYIGPRWDIEVMIEEPEDGEEKADLERPLSLKFQRHKPA